MSTVTVTDNQPGVTPAYQSGDTNNDGKPDLWAIDTDGDGKADVFQFDTNGDGKVDITMSDIDEDGTPEQVVDGDGGLPPATV